MSDSSLSIIRIFIGLGSNLGDRAGNLLLAVRGMLNDGLPIMRLSSIYETEPVEVLDQPKFLNMIAELEHDALISPEQLLARLLRIEHALGRRREARRGARTIDLDLLIYGSQQYDTEFLQLPHPRLHLRRFVLTPLIELAPEMKHPTLDKTFRELLDEIADISRVVKWHAKNSELKT